MIKNGVKTLKCASCESYQFHAIVCIEKVGVGVELAGSWGGEGKCRTRLYIEVE